MTGVGATEADEAERLGSVPAFSEPSGRRRRRSGRRALLGAPVGLVLAAVALTGCGGQREREAPVTVPAGRSVEVVGDDFSFDPEAVLVEPGKRGGAAKVEIRLRNQGSLAHNLKVFQGDREVGGTPTFQGGMVRSTALSLKPGDYRIECTVGDHAERGMVGRLTVR